MHNIFFFLFSIIFKNSNELFVIDCSWRSLISTFWKL
jgi:hypothetical protein